MAIQQPDTLTQPLDAPLGQSPDPSLIQPEPETTPAPAGVSASGEQDSVFTGERVDVAGRYSSLINPSIIKILTRSNKIDQIAPTPEIDSRLLSPTTTEKVNNIDLKTFREEFPDMPVLNEDGSTIKKPSELTPEEVKALGEYEARFISDSDLSKFDTTKQYHHNFKTYNGSDDVKAAQAATSELYRREIETAQGGPLDKEKLNDLGQWHLDQLASDVGLSREVMEKFLRRQHGGEIPPLQDILAVRKMLEDSSRDLKDMAHHIVKHGGSDQERLLFMSQLDYHRQLNAGYMGARADWGRVGHAFREGATAHLRSGQTSKDRLSALLDHYEGEADIDKAAADIVNADSVEAINLKVQAQNSGLRRATLAGIELYIASILSGLGTQVNNSLGMAVVLGKNIVDLQMAGLFGMMSKEHTDKVYVGEALAGTIHMLSSWKIASGAFWHTAKTGEQYGGVSKLEAGSGGGKHFSAEAMGATGPFGSAIDFTGAVLRSPLERVMGGTDAFMKVLFEKLTYGHLAHRNTMRDANMMDLSDDEIIARYQQYLENPDQIVRDEATAQGLRGAFQTPLGPAMRGVQSAINQKAPWLKIAIPFIRTPTNIIKVAFLENSPLFFISADMRRKLFPKPIEGKTGPNGEAVYEPGAIAGAQQARASLATGTMAWGYMVWMASQGRVSGSGPKDPDARAELMATGWRPRSILIRDKQGKIVKTVSYDGWEPLAQVIGLAVDTHNASVFMNHQDLDPTFIENATRMSAAGIFALTQNITNKSYLAGLDQILNAMTAADPYAPNKDSTRAVTRYMANVANSLAPFAGLRRDIRRAHDPYMRQTMDIWDRLADSVPILSEWLPYRRNIWGDKMKYDDFFSNRYSVVETEQDTVERELQQIFFDTGKNAVGMPEKKPFNVEIDAFDYVELVHMSRKSRVPVEGTSQLMDLKEQLAWKMAQPGWNDKTPHQKYEEISNIVSVRDRQAKARLFSKHERLDRKRKDARAKNQALLIGVTKEGESVRRPSRVPGF